MSTKECRIIGYVCFAFGAAFDYFHSPWVAMLLMIVALGMFGYVIYEDFKGGRA